jgi:hypothetical protein
VRPSVVSGFSRTRPGPPEGGRYEINQKSIRMPAEGSRGKSGTVNPIAEWLRYGALGAARSSIL